MGGGISKMAKQELLATIRDRYRASSKREKSRILVGPLATGSDPFLQGTGSRHAIQFVREETL